MDFQNKHQLYQLLILLITALPLGRSSYIWAGRDGHLKRRAQMLEYSLHKVLKLKNEVNNFICK